MTLPRGVRFRNLLTRIRSWEYWPFGVIQAPLFVQWLWYACRSGSLFWFSASNPSIYTGGMMGESKADVLALISDELKPATILVRLPADVHGVMAAMAAAGITFPCIFKPDQGERGWMVRLIADKDEAAAYLKEINIDFLVQAYVALPMEFGVFYVRKPDQEHGKIVSLTGKAMLTVQGNGSSTLGDLVLADDRARLQAERLHRQLQHRWHHVLPAGEKLMINGIGNHCLGTMFLDAGDLVNAEMENTFDRISRSIPGFFFGRYDLRCVSVSDLRQGRVMILELNGCGAEPAHIYQPGFPLFRAVGILIRHMRDMFDVSMQNHSNGTPFLSFREGLQVYRQVRKTIGK